MTNPDTTYAQLGDLQLEAVGEDELDEHFRTTPIYAELQAQTLRPGDSSGVSLPYTATFIPIPAEGWEESDDDQPDPLPIALARITDIADFVASYTDDEEPDDDTGEDVVAVQRAAFIGWAVGLILGGALGVIGWLELVNAS